MNREKDTVVAEQAREALVERLQSFCDDPYVGQNRRGINPARDDEEVQSGAYGHVLTFGDLRYIISALTVNTSTPGNDLAATRMEQLEKRVLKIELILSRMEPNE